ncbi:MAG: SDR family oxidoreductase [Myxococcota bacterium]
MDFGITGKRAAVAAASRGLGLATAKALCEEGVRVVVCGRDESRIQEAAASLGGGAVGLVADVSTPDGARRFVEQSRETLGGLDILVTNAGGPPPGNFASTDIEAYPDAIALNLMSVIAMCKEAVPGMREQKWGRVLAITSISVRQPLPGLILSNTARAGATGFLKTLAREVAADGVTVNSIQPGIHRTRRVEDIYGDQIENARQGIPAGVLGSADDFGRVAAFLCSESARFITGAGIPVDGGANAALQ